MIFLVSKAVTKTGQPAYCEGEYAVGTSIITQVPVILLTHMHKDSPSLHQRQR